MWAGESLIRCAVEVVPPCRRATLDIFSHVLGMDLQFHLHRKTGEVRMLGCAVVSWVETVCMCVMGRWRVWWCSAGC